RVRFALAAFFVCSSVSAATYVVTPDDALVGKADAVVVARALHSHVDDSKNHGIETVTVFAIEDALKGADSIDTVTVRVPGGTIETEGKPARFKLIPGAPRFVDGEPVLLFVTKVNGEYVVTDFGLGLFGFATDDLGH